MTGDFDSRKDSHLTKFEWKPQIFVKLSFRELCDSKLSCLDPFNNMLIMHWVNKNALTGLMNLRKQLDIMPTYHYVQNQGKLMIESQENDQKPQFGQFFDNFVVKYL